VLLIMGRNKRRTHSDRLYRDVKRRHGVVRAMLAVTLFKFAKLVLSLALMGSVVGCVALYLIFMA
jgi:hypothetical protein